MQTSIFIYSCSAQLISFEIDSISKEINYAEHEYMNMSLSFIELLMLLALSLSCVRFTSTPAVGIVQNMDWTGQLDWTIGLDSWTGQLDWTAGLDSYTGLLDWDSFLLNIRNSMFLRKAK